MISIKSHLQPRNDVPISNKYEVINNFMNDDFHVVIYFIDSNKCNIIVRRLDESTGWGQYLTIRIFSNNNGKYNDINVGSSNENYKNMYAVTDNILEPIHLNYQQIIPKVIIQTGPSNEMPILKYNSVMTFIELNPEYEYKFFDDSNARKFIRENFDEHILTAYDILVPGAFKADLFRYCYLYINGGCYFDCKMILREPLRNFVDRKAELIVCKDYGKTLRYYNAIILCAKKILNSTIVDCVNNIYNNYITSDPLAITGPQMFYNSLMNKNKVVSMEHFVDGHHSSRNYRRIGVKTIGGNKMLLNKFYKGYYESIGNNHYSVLNKKNEVYYKNKQNIGKDGRFIVFVYPNSNDDTFNFSIMQDFIDFTDNKSLIIKNNKNNGWKHDLKIKVIDTSNDKEKVINIGTSLFPTKHIGL